MFRIAEKSTFYLYFGIFFILFNKKLPNSAKWFSESQFWAQKLQIYVCERYEPVKIMFRTAEKSTFYLNFGIFFILFNKKLPNSAKWFSESQFWVHDFRIYACACALPKVWKYIWQNLKIWNQKREPKFAKIENVRCDLENERSEFFKLRRACFQFFKFWRPFLISNFQILTNIFSRVSG